MHYYSSQQHRHRGAYAQGIGHRVSYEGLQFYTPLPYKRITLQTLPLQPLQRMEINEQDDFQVIDSHCNNHSNYQLIESTRVEQAMPANYEVNITPTKNEVDLNIMENQYYQFEVLHKGELFCRIERRFSEFELMFDILTKKEGGFIFPAFPANGIFAYMKSKVSISKDDEFVKRRTKMIARFFSITINHPLFSPEKCSEMKIFLSPGKEFEARKQIEKGNKGVFNMSWTKLKTYFALGQESKYSDVQARVNHLKTMFQALYTKCRQLMDCLKEESILNTIFQNHPFSAQKLSTYIKMIERHNQEQTDNLNQLEQLEFLLFCENEDLLMVSRIFERLNQLKEDEDNYAQIKSIEHSLESRLEDFIMEKQRIRKTHELKLKWIIDDVKNTGRIK